MTQRFENSLSMHWVDNLLMRFYSLMGSGLRFVSHQLEQHCIFNQFTLYFRAIYVDGSECSPQGDIVQYLTTHGCPSYHRNELKGYTSKSCLRSCIVLLRAAVYSSFLFSSICVIRIYSWAADKSHSLKNELRLSIFWEGGQLAPNPKGIPEKLWQSFPLKVLPCLCDEGCLKFAHRYIKTGITI